jgi:hypothetical protein
VQGIALRNLFVRSKVSGRLFLISVGASSKADLNEIRRSLKLSNADQLRLAPDELLEVCARCVQTHSKKQTLSVKRGALAPFAMMFKKSDASVGVVLQKSLLDADNLLVHPMDNAATVSIAPARLLDFLQRFGVENIHYC